MPAEYSLSNVLERMYTIQLPLEAALMELTLQVEQQGAPEVGENVRGGTGTSSAATDLSHIFLSTADLGIATRF